MYWGKTYLNLKFRFNRHNISAANSARSLHTFSRVAVKYQSTMQYWLFGMPIRTNQCLGLRRTFSEIFTKFDAVPLSDPSWNRIRPNTRLQIKGHKNQHIHLAAWRFVLWVPRYASTVIRPLVSRYHNCFRDCSTSHVNYGYHRTFRIIDHKQTSFLKKKLLSIFLHPP
jgi:hypothetical protein